MRTRPPGISSTPLPLGQSRRHAGFLQLEVDFYLCPHLFLHICSCLSPRCVPLQHFQLVRLPRLLSTGYAWWHGSMRATLALVRYYWNLRSLLHFYRQQPPPPVSPPPTGLMLWIQILACPRPLSIDALPDSYNRSSILLLAPLFSPALHLPLASVCLPEMFSVGPPFPLAVPRSCLMAWLSGGGA